MYQLERKSSIIIILEFMYNDVISFSTGSDELIQFDLNSCIKTTFFLRYAIMLTVIPFDEEKIMDNFNGKQQCS